MLVSLDVSERCGGNDKLFPRRRRTAGDSTTARMQQQSLLADDYENKEPSKKKGFCYHSLVFPSTKKSIPLLFVKSCILITTILYCARSQLPKLRRLTMEDDMGMEAIDGTRGLLAQSNETTTTELYPARSEERRVSTSLLGRIQVESRLNHAVAAVNNNNDNDNNHRHNDETATRTRRVGAAAAAAAANRSTKYKLLEATTTATTNNERTVTTDVTRTRGTDDSNLPSSDNEHFSWSVLASPLSAQPENAFPNRELDAAQPENSFPNNDLDADVPISSIEKPTSAEVLPPPSSLPVFDGKYKIVGFTDYNSRKIALKWYQRLEDLGYRQHVLVVYDNAMADYLQSLNEERAYELKRRSNSASTETGENPLTMTATIESLEKEKKKTETEDSQSENYFYRFEKHILPPPPNTFFRLRRKERSRQNQEMMLAWRWHYVLQQLQEGVSVLLTNVGAKFHRYLDLESDPEVAAFDVLLASANASGNDLRQQQQPSTTTPVVHSGILWLKAKASTIQFVQTFVDTCGTLCDDRAVLNDMMMVANDPQRLGIVWDENTTTAAAAAAAATAASTMNQEEPPRTGHSSVTGLTLRFWSRTKVGVVNALAACGGGDGTENDDDPDWIAMPPPAPPIDDSSSFTKWSLEC